jgi:hypothetical protein
MGNVAYRARFTRNMGNFESLQVEIGVEDEPRGEELFDEAFNRVKDFVESRLLEGVDELESQIGTTRDEVVADFQKWRKSQKDK